MKFCLMSGSTLRVNPSSSNSCLHFWFFLKESIQVSIQLDTNHPPNIEEFWKLETIGISPPEITEDESVNGRLRLTSLQLQTTLTEIEAILNSRPLVYVGDEIDDKDILTPQHFLSLKKDHGLPVVGDIDEDLNDPTFLPKKDSASTLLETWKKGNQHLNQFWNIWKDQYLTSLRERSQILMKHSHIQDSKEAKIGDVVQIKENTPRGTWKIGRIIELIKNQDNIIRTAKVMTPNKTVLQRSLVHLYPLECNDESNNNNHNKHDVKTDQQNQVENSSTKEDRRTNIMQRPERKAAQTARDRIIAQEIQYE